MIFDQCVAGGGGQIGDVRVDNLVICMYGSLRRM